MGEGCVWRAVDILEPDASMPRVRELGCRAP